VHRSYKSSPLWGLGHEDFVAQNVEICVALTGIDETLAVPVCGQYAYPAETILWNRRLRMFLAGHRVVTFKWILADYMKR